MKKLLGIGLLIGFALVFGLVGVGCGGGGDEAPAFNLVGSWVFSSEDGNFAVQVTSMDGNNVFGTASISGVPFALTGKLSGKSWDGDLTYTDKDISIRVNFHVDLAASGRTGSGKGDMYINGKKEDGGPLTVTKK